MADAQERSQSPCTARSEMPPRHVQRKADDEKITPVLSGASSAPASSGGALLDAEPMFSSWFLHVSARVEDAETGH